MKKYSLSTGEKYHVAKKQKTNKKNTPDLWAILIHTSKEKKTNAAQIT